jgi:DNA helicase-4
LRRIKDDVNFRIRDSAIFWRNPENVTQILKLEFCSMHKSKGITRDIVIALNMNDDLMGMPAQREADPIIDSMLAHSEPFAFAEERRLFYVAITRAREATYLIANYQNPSPFLYEISSDLRDTRNELCPKCESGELKLKHGLRGDFYYCSNLRYGCDYLRKV